jgi:hypothetical protein
VQGRIWNIVQRRRLDAELQQEFTTDLALIEEEDRSQGGAVEEAQRNARVE